MVDRVRGRVGVGKGRVLKNIRINSPPAFELHIVIGEPEQYNPVL